MSSGELILTLLVAIVVFGPNKLPMLAEHLGRLICFINQLKQQASNFWQTQLQEQQLRENRKKAEKADAFYQQENKRLENQCKQNGSDTNLLDGFPPARE